jgi:hypothetical protein
MNYSSNMAHLTQHDRLAEHTSLRRAVRLRKVLALAVLLGLALSTSCNPTAVTVLQATFNNDTVGSPPAVNQNIGTLSFDPVAGRIKVVATPAPDVPSNKWVQITEDALRCNFSRFDGPGNYGVLASVFIPSTTPGIVTLSFVPVDPQGSVNFMHIDFMPEGDVRIDDGVRFGQIPKDRPFTISVKLAITDTNATAEITLFGTGASGSRTVNVDPQLMPIARRFGGVRFFMGFQQRGTFFVEDIIVTRTQ